MRRPLIITLLGLALSLVCLGIGAVLFFTFNNPVQINAPFDRLNISSELEESQSVDVNPDRPLRLQVNNQSGSVTVTGANVDTVQVDVVKTAYDSSQSRADAEVKNIEYTVEQTGDTIRLQYEVPDSMNFSNKMNTVDFVVTVPENTSLEVSAGAGNIRVSRLRRPIELEAGFGMIVLEDIQGAVSVDSQSGSIRVSRVESGQEDIVLATEFGDISILGASGQNVSITSKSGALQLQDVRLTGDLLASTDFGNLKLDRVNARSYDTRTNSGSITVDGAQGTLEAQSAFGNITVTNAEEVTIDLHTGSGSIDFEGSLGEGPHQIDSDFGEISISIPADSALDVDLQTNFGTIRSDIPITTTLSGENENNRQTGTMNGGGAQLTVQTESGGISIEARR